MTDRILRLLRNPLDDYLAGLDRALVAGPVPAIALLVLVAALAWWVYVPIHELLHAFGCIAAGGTVTRLEIDAIYGATYLQRWFPFVAVGSEYAGQLTGFDTHGSDSVYLATDFAPFLLTILPGVTLLRTAARTSALRSSAALGAAIPVAFAPFISLVGDYYEMGSIIASRAAAVAVPGVDVERWRSDDLVLLVEQLNGTWTGMDVVVVGAACVLSFGLALLTYALGRWVDGLLFEGGG